MTNHLIFFGRSWNWTGVLLIMSQVLYQLSYNVIVRKCLEIYLFNLRLIFWVKKFVPLLELNRDPLAADLGPVLALFNLLTPSWVLKPEVHVACHAKPWRAWLRSDPISRVTRCTSCFAVDDISWRKSVFKRIAKYDAEFSYFLFIPNCFDWFVLIVLFGQNFKRMIWSVAQLPCNVGYPSTCPWLVCFKTILLMPTVVLAFCLELICSTGLNYWYRCKCVSKPGNDPTRSMLKNLETSSI